MTPHWYAWLLAPNRPPCASVGGGSGGNQRRLCERAGIWFLDRRVNAGTVFGVPSCQDIAPAAWVPNRAKIGADLFVARMQLRVFDCEFSHVGQASIPRRQPLCQSVMFGNYVSLLVQSRRILRALPASNSRTCGKIQGFPIAPRAIDTPSTPVSRSMSTQACGLNRSPLPSTTRSPAYCFTSRRNSQRAGPLSR